MVICDPNPFIGSGTYVAGTSGLIFFSASDERDFVGLISDPNFPKEAKAEIRFDLLSMRNLYAWKVDLVGKRAEFKISDLPGGTEVNFHFAADKSSIVDDYAETTRIRDRVKAGTFSRQTAVRTWSTADISADVIGMSTKRVFEASGEAFSKEVAFFYPKNDLCGSHALPPLDPQCYGGGGKGLIASPRIEVSSPEEELNKFLDWAEDAIARETGTAPTVPRIENIPGKGK